MTGPNPLKIWAEVELARGGETIGQVTNSILFIAFRVLFS